MGLDDRGPLVDRIGEIAREVLAESERSGRSTVEITEARAWQRIEEAGGRARA
jgi:hypothetical protein